MAENSGYNGNYYIVEITNPTKEREPYFAECNDIIEALNMTFAEGEAFKAIWRLAAERQGNHKEGHKGALYDAQKVHFYSGRMVAQIGKVLVQN